MRHTATAFSARGRVDRRPSRWRKGRESSLPRVAAKWARAFWVRSLRVSWSAAWSVTDREAWNSRSLPRCTSSRRRDTSSRAISASGDRLRPRFRDMDWADSKRTFCHSRVRAAWSEGIASRWTERSMGAPAAIRPWRNPGASERGHLPRCRERTRWLPTRMSRRLTSTESSSSSSRSLGEPPRAEASNSSFSGWPFRGNTPKPARDSRPRSSSARACSQIA